MGGEIFRSCPDRLWNPPSLIYNGYRLFPGGKVAGAWPWPPTPPSSAEVKEIAELYLYSFSGSSWLVLGWTSPLHLPLPLPFPLWSHVCQLCLFSYLWILVARNIVITNNYIQRLCAYGVCTKNARLVSVRKHVTASPFLDISSQKTYYVSNLGS